MGMYQLFMERQDRKLPKKAHANKRRLLPDRPCFTGRGPVTSCKNLYEKLLFIQSSKTLSEEKYKLKQKMGTPMEFNIV